MPAHSFLRREGAANKKKVEKHCFKIFCFSSVFQPGFRENREIPWFCLLCFGRNFILLSAILSLNNYVRQLFTFVDLKTVENHCSIQSKFTGSHRFKSFQFCLTSELIPISVTLSSVSVTFRCALIVKISWSRLKSRTDCIFYKYFFWTVGFNLS